MIIDEVQRDPSLILAIKVAVDKQRPQKRGQVVLMMKQVGDSLEGRAYYLRLRTLARREQQGLGTAGIWTSFLETPASDWLETTRAAPNRQEDWRQAVRRGGFPAVALETHNEQERSLRYDGYIATYLERDLRELHAVANLQSSDASRRITCWDSSQPCRACARREDASDHSAPVHEPVGNVASSNAPRALRAQSHQAPH